jgi:hypothetical protein
MFETEVFSMSDEAKPNQFPLSDAGLIAVKDAADRRGWAVKSVQNWINAGLIPFTVAGGGMRTVFLLWIKDVDAFTPPPRGRPAKADKPAEKKKRGRKQSV